jgi:hypothetical protein
MSDAAQIPPPPEEPHMEIHKPKPFHNWREFLTEIGVVVLGVGIALAAEQSVEALHWQGRIADARRAMTAELRDDDGPQAYIRIATQACRSRAIDAIRSAVVAKARRRDIAQLVARYPLGSAPTWDSVAWNTLQSSDVASHISPEELRRWSLPYAWMPRLDSTNLQEVREWTALQPSGLTDAYLSASEVETMLAAIARLGEDNRSLATDSGRLLSGMLANGVSLTSDQKRRMLEAARQRFADCVIEPSIAARNLARYAAVPGKP